MIWGAGGGNSEFSWSLFCPVCELDVALNHGEARKMAAVETEDGKVEKHYPYYNEGTV